MIKISRESNAIVYEKPVPTKASLMGIQNVGGTGNKNINPAQIGNLS